MIRVSVLELRAGDMVDLEADPYADPQSDSNVFPFEYATVAGIERETDECVRVDFENADSVGFPVDHMLTMGDDSTPWPGFVTAIQALSARGDKVPSKTVQRAAISLAVDEALSTGVLPVLLYHVQSGANNYMVALTIHDHQVVAYECACEATTICKHALLALAGAARDGYPLNEEAPSRSP